MRETIAALLSIVASMIWWYWLNRRQTRLTTPLVSFGSKHLSISLAERKVILNEYVCQHRWSFALVWVAVALSVVISGLLLCRVLLAKSLTGMDVASIIEVAGELSIAGSAFRLYRKSERQLNQFLETFTRERPVNQNEVDNTL